MTPKENPQKKSMAFGKPPLGPANACFQGMRFFFTHLLYIVQVKSLRVIPPMCAAHACTSTCTCNIPRRAQPHLQKKGKWLARAVVRAWCKNELRHGLPHAWPESNSQRHGRWFCCIFACMHACMEAMPESSDRARSRLCWKSSIECSPKIANNIYIYIYVWTLKKYKSKFSLFLRKRQLAFSFVSENETKLSSKVYI